MQILSKVEQVKYLYKIKLKINQGGFPGGSMVESLPASAGDSGSTSDMGRSHMSQSTWVLAYNYWVCALEPRSHNYWTHVLQLLKPVCPTAPGLQQEKPPQWEGHFPQLEQSLHSNEDQESPKWKIKKLNYKKIDKSRTKNVGSTGP